MPTVFGHAAFAAALGAGARARAAVIAAAIACAIVPDLDVVAFRLGIPYGALLGHRGFSHSLAFAIGLGLVAAILLRAGWPSGSPRPAFGRTFALLAAATASHGLLDAATDGGLGVAFFSPFDETRYFLPWRPIAVSPIGIERFFSGGGSAAVRSELLWIGLSALAVGLASRLIVRRGR